MKVSITLNGINNDHELNLNVVREDLVLGKKEWNGKLDINGSLITLCFIEFPLGKVYTIEKDERITTSLEQIENQLNDQLLERFEIEQMGLEDTESKDVLEAVPYDPKHIKIRNENWSIKYIYDLIKEFNDVNLNPDFQREFVWDKVRKSRLIESLMLGIPIPAFYLAENDRGKMSVVDGLQRLTVIESYLSNEFPLKKLEYLQEYEGFYFKDDSNKKGIPFEFVKRILQTQINVNIIEASSPLKVKYDVFRRINTGGKPLNNQEIRNCLAEPSTRELINSLAKSEEFKDATGNSVKTVRMDAQELVLRFIAFYYIRNLNTNLTNKFEYEYKGDMQTLLDECVGRLNTDGSKYHQIIKRDFLNAILNAKYLFGKFSFRKIRPEHLDPRAPKQLINKSLFLTWSILLSQYNFNVVKEQNQEGAFAEILATQLDIDPDYWYVVSLNTSDKNFLDMAFRKAETIILQNLNYPK